MLELLTPSEMQDVDRIAVTGGIPGIRLMEAAGAACARAAQRLAPEGRIVVVCGPGNNGGDGFVAARLLAEQGREVRILLMGDRGALTGDVAQAASRWGGEAEPAAPSYLGQPALIIDALFGAGLKRPLEGAASILVQAINRSGSKVLAVDLPSGISGADGDVLGIAVRASETVTFFRLKPGHLLLPGRAHCGAVTCADIGIPSSVLETVRPDTFQNLPGLWQELFPVPRIDAHKFSRGHVAVHSGGLTSTGASRLASRAALRIGAGLVTIGSPSDALAVQAAANLAVMVRRTDTAEDFATLVADRRFRAAVVGPGGGVGQAMRRFVRAAAQEHIGLVLDADALTSFADNLAGLTAAVRHAKAAVLTPHEGEFQRLFGNLEGSKLARARHAAALTGAVVLLKGPDTVIAAPDGRAAINDNAPPYLATAGAGDVLAGTIAGLLAQGMPPFEAACAGVWVHSEAACRFGIGLIADDLSDRYPDILKSIVGNQFVCF